MSGRLGRRGLVISVTGPLPRFIDDPGPRHHAAALASVIGRVVMTGRGSAGKGLDVQSTRPRDLGALAFVIGLFAVMLVTSLALGSPYFR